MTYNLPDINRLLGGGGGVIKMWPAVNLVREIKFRYREPARPVLNVSN